MGSQISKGMEPEDAGVLACQVYKICKQVGIKIHIKDCRQWVQKILTVSPWLAHTGLDHDWNRQAKIYAEANHPNDVENTINQLTGFGDYAEFQQQLALPEPIIRAVQEVAMKALDALAARTQTLISHLRQRQSESALEFMTRVQEAVWKRFGKGGPSSQLIVQLFKEGLTKSRGILSTLPADPSVDEIVDKCLDEGGGADPKLVATLTSAFQAFQLSTSSKKGHYEPPRDEAIKFLVRAIAVVLESPPLNWKSDTPIWVEQWSLTSEKLQALQLLVKEQLAPWNAPVFVIKKKSGKVRFLTDVNEAFVSTWQQLYLSKEPVCILINLTLKAILAKQRRGKGRLIQSELRSRGLIQSELRSRGLIQSELDTAVSKSAHTTPAMRHFVTFPRQPRKESNTQAGYKDTWAMVKDMASGKWKGLYKILIWGPGYVCVSIGKGHAWIPIRRIRKWEPMSESLETPEKDHTPPEPAADSFNLAAQRGSSPHHNRRHCC
ncbi:uncharacterized protein [Notamacropus eugenii]|uniref:uncharacterized protein n=1 Tax=Notamacropus eugenii TaxID=9315 RepID=UPI003B68163C